MSGRGPGSAGLVLCAVGALVWTLAARWSGPSDLWDHTQSRTVSYTTDIIANGHWILPVERGEARATKPPLYNWLAVPAVAGLGYDREFAHKLPSVLALVATWGLCLVVGRRLGTALALPWPGRPGWLAALMFASQQLSFKLGYLARPDMLLMFWLLLGWALITAQLVAAGDRRPPPRVAAGGFWICVGLAALTKGPAALVLVAYAILAAPWLGGGWRGLHALRWWWGIPLAAALGGSWCLAVWGIDPAYLREELWGNEVWGRVTGTGLKGSGAGPSELLRGLPTMGLYYLGRFLPWSVPSLLAVLRLWGPSRRTARAPLPAGGRAWLDAAALMVVVTIGLYSLSASRRADYAAPACGPGAVLAAWWLIGTGPRLSRRAGWLAPLAAALMLAILTVHNHRAPTAPSRGFGDAIMTFAHEARAAIAGAEMPVVFTGTGTTHLQAMLGYSQREDSGLLEARLAGARPFLVVAGGFRTGPWAFAADMARRHPRWRLTAVVRSAMLPNVQGWKIQVTLFRLDPPSLAPSRAEGS